MKKLISRVALLLIAVFCVRQLVHSFVPSKKKHKSLLSVDTVKDFLKENVHVDASPMCLIKKLAATKK